MSLLDKETQHLCNKAERLIRELQHHGPRTFIIEVEGGGGVGHHGVAFRITNTSLDATPALATDAYNTLGEAYAEAIRLWGRRNERR